MDKDEAHMMNPSDKYEQIKDIKRLNPVELEAMVLCHEQQIKNLATHLLELKQLVKPISADYERGFDDGFILRKEKDGKREWVGLTDEEKSDLWCKSTGRNCVSEDTHVFADAIEAKLREKNGC